MDKKRKQEEKNEELLRVIEIKNQKIRELTMLTRQLKEENADLREAVEEFEASGARRRPKPKPKAATKPGEKGQQQTQQQPQAAHQYNDEDDFWQEQQDAPQPIEDNDLWIQNQAADVKGALGGNNDFLKRKSKDSKADKQDMAFYGVGMKN